MVHSSRGDPRTVVDYRYPNSYMARRTCRYETLADLAQVQRPADALQVWNVADAYHHLLILPSNYTYLAFSVGNRIIVPFTMPFGLRATSHTWTKVCRPVLQRLRQIGFRTIAYVDEFGGATPEIRGRPASTTQVVDAFARVRHLFQRLRLRVRPNKGVRHGPTSVRLLGHMGDTERRLFLLPPDRALALQRTALAFGRWAAIHRRHVEVSALRSFLGSAVSTTLIVPKARYHLFALYAAINARRPGTDAELTHQAFRKLSWWTRLN